MSPCLTPSLPEAASSIVNSISTTSGVQGTRIQKLLCEKKRSPPTHPSAMFRRILSLSQLCSPFAGNEGVSGVPVETVLCIEHALAVQGKLLTLCIHMKSKIKLKNIEYSSTVFPVHHYVQCNVSKISIKCTIIFSMLKAHW